MNNRVFYLSSVSDGLAKIEKAMVNDTEVAEFVDKLGLFNMPIQDALKAINDEISKTVRQKF
ncbi:MAG: hypothetical protein ACOCQR_02470 [bacterium]